MKFLDKTNEILLSETAIKINGYVSFVLVLLSFVWLSAIGYSMAFGLNWEIPPQPFRPMLGIIILPYLFYNLYFLFMTELSKMWE